MTAAVAASPPAAVWKALARRLCQPGRARIKVFDPDTKAYLKTRRLSDTLPAQMAAVYLYNQRRTTLLAFDFDSKIHGRSQVDADFAQAREWLAACGARLISDQSTNGGRHILVPLAIGTTASIDEIKPLMHQLKARLPSLDITPMLNPAEGCISVPGTPCAGGYRQLDGQLITPPSSSSSAPRSPWLAEYRSPPRRGRTRQRRASGHSPRHSSNVARTSAVVIDDGRRPVRDNHSAMDGRDASRAASRRRSSGTVMPSSAARRTSAAYTSSSISRICTVLGIFAFFHADLHDAILRPGGNYDQPP